MFTANTMSSSVEALGMALPGIENLAIIKINDAGDFTCDSVTQELPLDRL